VNSFGPLKLNKKLLFVHFVYQIKQKLQQVGLESIAVVDDDTGSLTNEVSQDWHRLFHHFNVLRILNVVEN
jgi:hypothetical protein